LWQVHTLQANFFLPFNPQTRGTPVKLIRHIERSVYVFETRIFKLIS